MKKEYLFIFLTSLIILSNCSQKNIPYSYHKEDSLEELDQETTDEKSEEEDKDKFEYFSIDSIKIQLRLIVDSVRKVELFSINGEYIFSTIVLPELYAKGDYMLNWYDQKNRYEALECLQNSWMDGLNPEDYHLNEIQRLRDDILSNESLDYSEIAEFDVLLTDGLLLYAYHLIKGKINPHTLDVNWNFSSRGIPKDPTQIFLNAIENRDIKSAIHDFRPKDEIYYQFISSLVRYKEIENSGGWEEINIEGVVKPGEFHNQLDKLRERLFISGDIKFKEGFLDTLYDEDLEAAVKRFQQRHGLEPDGVIGKNTIAALNIPVQNKLDMLRINMERARWILDEDFSDAILVNIANFKLFYLNDTIRVHKTKVMVGTYYNQTPVFKSKMKYMVFNPTWTVPYSIATKEILPKIKKDPNYLADRNISLLAKNGKVIPQNNVDWTKINRQNFPYTLRQEPGPGNALGQVKFIFPNKYSVYLHDTPSKYLFAKDQRAFSHGCIRVQYPLKLAEVLLNDEKWNSEKIQEVLGKKKEKVVHLKKPLDVLLFYWTTGFEENGDVFFIKDIYNRDDKILAGLQNNNWEELLREYHNEISKEQASTGN